MLHEARRRIPDVQRDGPRAVFGDEGTRLVVRNVHRVALGRAGEVDRRLGERELAFRCAEPLVGLDRVQRESQCARVGKPDVLARHADDPSPKVQGVGAPVEHATQPVQRSVGIAAAYRLVQRRDLVVERLATLVEAAQRAGDRGFDECEIDVAAPCPARRDRQLLDQIDQPPPVAVRIGDNRVARRGRERSAGHGRGKSPVE